MSSSLFDESCLVTSSPNVIIAEFASSNAPLYASPTSDRISPMPLPEKTPLTVAPNPRNAPSHPAWRLGDARPPVFVSKSNDRPNHFRMSPHSMPHRPAPHKHVPDNKS